MTTDWGLPEGSPGNSLVPGKFTIGNRLVGQIVRADITAYTNPGGETLDPRQFGMFEIIWIGGTSTEYGGYTMQLNQSRTALLLFDGAGTELANTVDGGTWDLLIIGVPGY